jgi:hypothetical protein
MKKLLPLFFAAFVLILFSCEKEYSLENSGNNNNGLIVGTDCRISKIVYTDTGTGRGIGSIAANINNLDVVTGITKFDSLSNTIDFITTPAYVSDTIFINADEYFLIDVVTRRIKQLHALVDPTDPFSTQLEITYFYNNAGYLSSKITAYTSNPGVPIIMVNYTYVAGKLTHMTKTDLITGDLDVDADVNYYSNILPNRFLYIFPDEKDYPYFSQFYNFGTRPANAPKDITVRNYDPGGILRDSTVSKFSNYMMSRDNYVLSVLMTKDDLISIPAVVSKLSFSYKCK